jgi:hypothetical protein
MDYATIATVIIGLVTGVMVPAVKSLFGKFAKLDERLEAERESRRQLELKMALEYVSQAALEKIMTPFQKDINNMERMMERIAAKLHIPAIDEG